MVDGVGTSWRNSPEQRQILVEWNDTASPLPPVAAGAADRSVDGSLVCATDLYDQSTISRLVTSLQSLLVAGLTNPMLRISQLASLFDHGGQEPRQR